jgi:hypothetical protein
MPNYNYPYYSTQPNAFPTQMNVGATQPTQSIPQIQDGGFVTIPNADMVYNYPVAMGKCVTFKVEGKPIIIEKSMGFSQLDSPKIERYRLVKEENEVTETSEESISELDKVKSDIKEIWGKLDEIENSKKNSPRRENKNGES